MQIIIDNLINFWLAFKEDFYNNFIYQDRWVYLWDGLKVTLLITLIAVLIGTVIGFIAALIRTTHDKTNKLKFLNGIVKLYLTVIRGTPVTVQILIIYFSIFKSVDISKILVGCIAFGINSGAYIAEIVRGGINSIDEGQFEAGRSLGFNYVQTMTYIILPQAIKNIIPSLANEFIVLLKETSVAGFIALQDLTKGAEIIRSLTYSDTLPLLGAAVIYLVLVLAFEKLVSILERRMKASER